MTECVGPDQSARTDLPQVTIPPFLSIRISRSLSFHASQSFSLYLCFVLPSLSLSLSLSFFLPSLSVCLSVCLTVCLYVFSSKSTCVVNKKMPYMRPASITAQGVQLTNDATLSPWNINRFVRLLDVYGLTFTPVQTNADQNVEIWSQIPRYRVVPGYIVPGFNRSYCHF